MSDCYRTGALGGDISHREAVHISSENRPIRALLSATSQTELGNVGFCVTTCIDSTPLAITHSMILTLFQTVYLYKKKKRGDYKEEEEVSNQYKVKAEDDEREPDHNKSLVRVVLSCGCKDWSRDYRYGLGVSEQESMIKVSKKSTIKMGLLGDKIV
ncbi:hypothetical protein YC2023_050942 [Brassica napus]